MAFGLHSDRLNPPGMTFGEKLAAVNWLMVLLLTAIACIGFAMLYSAANGSFAPWAYRQMIRFGVGFAIMLTIAMVDIRVWMRGAYLIYAGVLVLLVAVEVMGEIGMGAQRWTDLGVFQLPPSERMQNAQIVRASCWERVGRSV